MVLKSIFYIYFLFLSLCAFTQVKTTIDTTQIQIGEVISLRYQSKEKVNWIQENTLIKNDFEIVADSFFIDGKIFNRELKITTFNDSLKTIPPLKYILKSDTLNTLGYEISIHKIQTEKGAIKELDSIIEYKLTVWDYLKNPVIYILFLALFLLMVLFYFFKKIKQQKEAPKLKRILNPTEEALLLLDELNSKDYLEQHKFKEFHLNLDYIIRNYLGKTYAIDALESTTYEVIDLVKSTSLNLESQQKINQFIQHSEMVKFAKKPSNKEQSTNFYFWIRNFIEQNVKTETDELVD